MASIDTNRNAAQSTETLTNIRALAAQSLAPLIRHQGSLKTLLPGALARCPERDRALLQQLCYGVMRYHPQLSLLSRKLLKKPFASKDYDLLVLLWSGLYQLEHMRIAPHAAISETVAGARVLGKEWATGLLNAVLRRYQREHETLKAALAEKPAFRYNHPDWFVQKLQHNWPEHWQQILNENNASAPMTLRVNARQHSRERYLQQLHDAGIEAHACQFAAEGIQLAQPCDVGTLPGFADGTVSVQDEAAQLSAELLALQPDQRLLDACAAPGGKLCHALEQQPDLEAIAIELEQSRAGRIRDNLARLQLDAEVKIADAALQDWWDGRPFERILVDAPCSATGVIRRNPDICFLRKGEDIATLSDIQLAVLSNCWQMLAPGGRLVYATCSIFPQENERLIARFLKQVGDASHQPIVADWGIERPLGRQLMPQPDGHDGFYYCVLTKNMCSDEKHVF
ncbi:MAG: 16S rRNA (cytosine(967)-C(5))-methyltransferase RsmB [Marinobacterium sp.]|nr:16S rRNA (cytosine(967)-C(5))-methyltransferase RsmB [Marinobacterium sp.]